LYESRYGLSFRPYGETLSGDRFVSLPSREQAVRRLLYGLDQGAGAVLLVGLPGVGKSVVARRVLEWSGGEGIHLTFPAVPGGELLGLIASEFGLLGSATEPAASAKALALLRRHLAARREAGTRVLLVVDDAQTIDDPSAFESLRLLLNVSSGDGPDLGLLLVGGPEILLRISPALADRIGYRCVIHPLTEAETEEYLVERAEAAGADRPLFTAEALRLLARAGEGQPRRLNRLADLSLLLASCQGMVSVDERIVRLAAHDLGLADQAA
jgi:type II secretory pathway predicted ATPase ExeA